MSDLKHILEALPYRKPFHFVDELESVTEEGARGYYSMKPDEYFYEGHFPGNPVTPGVIITEIMAQIGLVCLGIFLEQSKSNNSNNFVPLFSSAQVDFLKPVYPGEKLLVQSKKIYYRFGKLKCEIKCMNFITGEVVSSGEFSGMIIKKESIGK